jgi:hypothetical protein
MSEVTASPVSGLATERGPSGERSDGSGNR